MFILGDENARNSRIPWVTGSLVLVNILAFLAQKYVGDRVTYGFSLVPYEITHMKDLTKAQKIKMKVPVPHPDPELRDWVPPTIRDTWVDVPQYPGPFPIILTLLTSMFLHGDWVHLISNMWFLIIFGRNVESAWNHRRFLGFYLACGLVGGLCHVLSDTNSIIPCLGASGAISGIMGAYVAIFPFNKVKLWFGIYIGVVEVPALVVIGIWFLWQYISVFVEMDLGRQAGGGIAYWDHIGGFMTGLLLVWATVWSLKRQLARQGPPPEENEPAPPPSAAVSLDSTKADEVFAKAASMGAGGSQVPQVPQRPDPFGSFLPPSTPPPAPDLPRPARRDPAEAQR